MRVPCTLVRPESLSPNPNGVFATLAHDDLVVCELRSIQRFLVSTLVTGAVWANEERSMNGHHRDPVELMFLWFFERVRKPAEQRDSVILDKAVKETAVQC